MEILRIGVIVVLIAALSIGATWVTKQMFCQDCPLKERCNQSVKNGNGFLCNEKNSPNQFMTTTL